MAQDLLPAWRKVLDQILDKDAARRDVLKWMTVVFELHRGACGVDDESWVRGGPFDWRMGST